MKQPFRRAVSIVCAFTLAVSLVPSVALADGGGEEGGGVGGPDAALELLKEADTLETVSLEVDPVDVGDQLMAPFAVTDFDMPLKEGNYEKWIDRVEVPDYARSFYEMLEEACDNDGFRDFLIDDAYANGTANDDDDDRYVVNTSQGVLALLAFGGKSYSTEEEKNAQQLQLQYELAIILAAFDRDHPEVFWITHNMDAVFATNSTTTVIALKVASQRTSMYQTEQSIKEGIENRDRWAHEIMGTGSEIEDDEGKIRFFNQWLTQHNEYNTSDDLDALWKSKLYPNAWECVSALEGNEGTRGPVCEAYARAFKVLCDKSGIPCVLVDGEAVTSAGSGGHMWNYVKLEDDWYGVDVTWNDPLSSNSGKLSGYECDSYLLVGENTKVGTMSFIESHPVSNDTYSFIRFPNGPVLSGEKYSPVEIYDCVSKGHVYGALVEADRHEPTCVQPGSIDRKKTCIYCKNALAVPETIPALGHKWGPWEKEREPTCIAVGAKKRVCDLCGESEGEDLPLTDHIYGGWHTVKDATCTEEGKQQRECATCKQADTQILPIDPSRHSYGAWTTVQPATCTGGGSEQRVCTNVGCTHSETRPVAATGHAMGEWKIDQAPTCTESGTEVRRCNHEGCAYMEPRVVPAPGHKVESGKVEGATCTEDGFESGVCSTCGATVDSQPAPGTALGHSWGAWRVAAAATCTVSGVEERTCSRDGSHHDTRVIPAIGHAMGSWTTVRPATCTVPGAEQRRCTHAGCAYSETRATAATGHAMGAYRPNGDAKVGVNGTETATCSKCGARTTRTAAGSALAPAVGQTVSAGGASFAVTGAATVTYAGPASKTATSATVPATVKVSGRTYKVTSISAKAFAGNKRLKSVKIGANVTAVPNGAFKGCTKLAKVSFGANVKTVGSKAFYGCKSLKSVTLGSKVTSIGTSAFQNCSKLAKVTVKSKSLKSIGKSAFAGCKKLKAVTLKTTKLKSVGKNALKGTAKKLTVKVPKAKVRAYQKLFKSKGSKTVRVKK